MNVRPLLEVHQHLWRDAIASLWERRHAIVYVTALLWIPWKLAVPLIDGAFGVRRRLGLPLEWIVDPFYEPFYGAVILVLLADGPDSDWRKGLFRGLWFLPRIWLIELKIAVWGLAVPYLVLHIGSAVAVTIWPGSVVARVVLAATVLSMSWIVVVMLLYLLAPAVMIAEWQAEGWPPWEHSVGAAARERPAGVSTGWVLWAARQLVRGQMRHAVCVLVVGQIAITFVQMLVPPGDHPLVQVAKGMSMLATAVWWALIWQFCGYCVRLAD